MQTRNPESQSLARNTNCLNPFFLFCSAFQQRILHIQVSHLANKGKIFFNKGDKSQILSIPSAKKEKKQIKPKEKGMNSPSNPSYCKSVHRYTESFMTTLVTYQRCVSKMCIHILLREENLFLQDPLLLACMKGGSYPTVAAQ